MLLLACAFVHAQNLTRRLSSDWGRETSSSSSRNSGSKNKNSKVWGRDTTKTEVKIPIGQFQWKIDERLGTVIPAVNRDTAVHNFQNWKLNDGMNGEYSDLGNVGSARLSRIFMNRNEVKDMMFLSPYNYFRGSVRDFYFTNTLSPITNLAYHSMGNKITGEARVRAYFASNINKVSGIGFKLDYLYGRGLYSQQQVSEFGGTVYGYYRGDKYNMHAYINANHMKCAENGGIADDRYVVTPDIFQRSFDDRDVPINLNDTYNRNDDQTYFLTQRYNLGYYKERFVPDSLKPKPPSAADLLLELPDSVRDMLMKDSVARKFAVDSLLADWESKLVKPKDYILVASIIHTIDVRHLDHTFYDNGYNRDYWTRYHPYGLGGIEDHATALTIRNTLGFAMCEGFRKWVKMGITFFATHQYRKYGLPTLNNDIMSMDNVSEHDVLIGGEISKRNGKLLHYDVNGEFCIVGENVGDISIDARGDLNLGISPKDSLNLDLGFKFMNQNPSYFWRHYRNTYTMWDNDDLSRQVTLRLDAELRYSRTKTRLRFGFANITNYTYLQMANTPKPGVSPTSTTPSDFTHDACVLQTPSSVQVLSASLLQDLSWKIIHWDNEVTYQHSTNSQALPLPAINIYSNFYLLFRIAKVLRCQIGTDLRFFTNYTAPDYHPASGLFAVQDPNNTQMKLGCYPILNAYANFHLKHCRIYVNVAHTTCGGGNRFLVPHYPMNGLNVNFGLSWNFFN